MPHLTFYPHLTTVGRVRKKNREKAKEMRVLRKTYEICLGSRSEAFWVNYVKVLFLGDPESQTLSVFSW